MQFLIVEYPDHGTPMPDFTRQHPGATIDVIAEPAQDLPGGDRLHPCVALVHGAPWDSIVALVRAFEGAYDSVKTLQRDGHSSLWLGRMGIRESTFRHTATYEVLLFQRRFGAPWAHLEAGVIHLRARLPPTGLPPGQIDAMQAELQRIGIPAQVEVREISAKDHGVWQTLIASAVGLGP